MFHINNLVFAFFFFFFGLFFAKSKGEENKPKVIEGMGQ